MSLAKFFNCFISSRPGRRNDLVTFGLIIRNPFLPAKRIHEHAVNKNDGFGFHNNLLICADILLGFGYFLFDPRGNNGKYLPRNVEADADTNYNWMYEIQYLFTVRKHNFVKGRRS